MTSRRSILGSVRHAIASYVGIVSGSGKLVTREYDLRDFTDIDASVFDVEVKRGDSFAVSVTADDNLFDVINVRTRGDSLRLGVHNRVHLVGRYTLEASITMPVLREVTLNGAATADVSGFTGLKVVHLELNGASRLRGALTADTIEAWASGASRLSLKGNAPEVRLNGSGASRFDLSGLTTFTAEVELSGASSATIDVTERIAAANLSGASTLRYSGSPKLRDVQTSGASTIRRV